MNETLNIAAGLSLPIELAARTQVILAMKGAGKTYTALRETEELLEAGQQVVALDPTGVCWGLRSARPGPGGRSFDIIVLGGEHGDAPLEPTAGAIVARFVCESRRSVVLDLSAFESNAAQDRFATDFAETLYRLKASDRSTLHLMVDEADSFAPQRPMPAQNRMLGAFEAIVRRGRSRGLGITMISQRPAVLNKNVMSQADLLVCLRVVGAHDHKALSEWAGLYGEKSQIREFMETLPRLQTGEAWFWSPGWLKIFQRAKVTARVSFDSSSTPEPGAVRAEVKMRPVNLPALSAEIQASIEQARENDPAKLKAEVAQLRRERDAAVQAAQKPSPREALLAPADLSLLRQSLANLQGLAAKLEGGLSASAGRPSAKPIPTAFEALPPLRTPAAAHRAAPLSKAERMVLTVLRQCGGTARKARVALIAGYASKGGGFNNALASLRTGGLVAGSDPLSITEAGAGAIGPVPPLPSGAELRRHWQAELGKAEAAILEELGQQPSLSKAELAALCGYAANGGGFNNALSKLRTLELITGSQAITLAEVLR